jgi:hypothetical protein
MTDLISTVSGTEEACGSDSTNLNRNNPNAPYGCSNSQDISDQRNSDDKNSTLVEYAINQVNKPLAVKTAQINQSLSKINRNSNKIQHANELLQLSANQNNEDLQKLKDFELEISTKNKMVKIAQGAHEKKIVFIKSIVGLLIVLCLSFIPLALMMSKIISKNVFIIIFVVLCIVGFIVFSWINNLFYVKDYFTFSKSGLAAAIDTTTSELSSWEESTSNSVSQRVQSYNEIIRGGTSETDWIDENCTCPETTPTNEDIPIPFSTSGELVWPEPGFYYDDGTAPNQLLVPNNTKVESERQFNERIQWPNYSKKRGPQLMPSEKPMDEADDRLVGNTTNTRNL